MKFLILLMLVACGKHQEPSAIDLRDSDGDQIQNYQESEFDKYVADYDRLEGVSGVIKFLAGKSEELSFTNQSDLKEDTLKLVVGDDSGQQRDQYFSEWSELRLGLSENKIEVQSDLNWLYITFDPMEVKPNELVLIDGKAEKFLGPWSREMRVQLTKVELEGILSGKKKLALRKKFPKAAFYLNDSEETIRAKTYKVYTFNGKKSKVLYVSKELTLAKLLKHLEISEVTNVTDEDLFFNSKAVSDKKWFLREYANGNKALAYYTEQDLKEVFREKFVQTKVKVERLNGYPTSNLSLANAMNSNVFLIVRPSATIRTFKEYTEVSHHRTGSAYHGSDEKWTCTHHKRKIETEVARIPTIEEFVNHLDMGFYVHKVSEQLDEKGIFWELMLKANVANLTLSLPGLNPSTFTTTGQHYIDCGYQGKGSTAATPTNFEGKLSFEIESFVEKLQ